jgi:hypothetical protein
MDLPHKFVKNTKEGPHHEHECIVCSALVQDRRHDRGAVERQQRVDEAEKLFKQLLPHQSLVVRAKINGWIARVRG